MKKLGPEQIAARREAWDRLDRGGVDKNTIILLIGHGIHTREALLSWTDAELANIPGIGKAALARITRYRARCLGN
jgi:Helix-hairpin-helix domain